MREIKAWKQKFWKKLKIFQKTIWQRRGLCYIKPHAPRMGGSADENAVSVMNAGSEKNWKIYKFGFDKRKNDAKLNLTLLKRSGADLKACRKKVLKKVSNETWQNKKLC